MMEKEILLDEIKVSSRRLRTSKEKSDDIKRLVDSIKHLGLFHPILVDDDYNLIAGFRRLTAYKQLREDDPTRFNTIKTHVVPKTDRLKKLQVEFEENWARKQLGAKEIKDAQTSIGILKSTKKKGLDYELDTTLVEMKKVYEQVHPEVKHGGRAEKGIEGFVQKQTTAKKTESQVGDTPTYVPQVTTKVAPSFATNVAEQMGLNRSTIEKRIRVGEAIEKEVYTEEEVESYKEGQTSHTKMLETYEERKKLTEQLSESLQIEKEKAREIAKKPVEVRQKILGKPLVKYNFTFTVDGIVETSKEDIVLLSVGQSIARIGKNKAYWEVREPEEIVITVKRVENENDDV